MDLRAVRGMELAEHRTIRKRDGWWWVPSQTGTGLYRVQIAKKFATCECPDFDNSRRKLQTHLAACVMSASSKNGTLTAP